MTRRIQVRHASAGAQLDMVLIEPSHWLGHQRGARNLTPEILFAERRAMIRAIDLLPDQQD